MRDDLHVRHGRARPGHPRLDRGEDVDARDKPGHDVDFRHTYFRHRFHRGALRLPPSLREQGVSLELRTDRRATIFMFVMAGPVPAIHVLTAAKTWMPGTSPGMTWRGSGLTHRA